MGRGQKEPGDFQRSVFLTSGFGIAKTADHWECLLWEVYISSAHSSKLKRGPKKARCKEGCQVDVSLNRPTKWVGVSLVSPKRVTD